MYNKPSFNILHHRNMPPTPTPPQQPPKTNLAITKQTSLCDFCIIKLQALRGTSQKLRQQAYFSRHFVRPHLEHCNTAWNPYIKEVNKIENIQHRAVRFVLNNYNQRGSVSAWINHLRWDSPEKGRQLSCLLLMSRIQNQLIVINGNHYLTPILPTCPVQGIIISKYIYKINPDRIKVYSNSFFPRTVFWWNALPGNVLVAPTIQAIRVAAVSHF